MPQASAWQPDMFASPQQLFAAALLDAERPVPPGLSVRPGSKPETGFAVYRNNVVVGLIDTLRATFPVVERIVGEEFFGALAQVFVTRHPPRSPVLSEYGDAFAGFLADFPPAAEIPYLPDIARLERAATRAYHAADAEPVPMAALQEIPPENLGGIRFRLHPSLSVQRSIHPVVTIRAMNLGLLPLGPIDELGQEDALVVRPLLEVEVHALRPGEAAFIQALDQDRTLAEAAEAAFAETAAFDIPAALARLFVAGAAISILQAKEALS